MWKVPSALKHFVYQLMSPLISPRPKTINAHVVIKYMKKIFIQDIQIFNSELLICVGVSGKQVKAWLGKNANKELIKLFDDKKIAEFDKFTKGSNGAVFKIKGELDYYVLYLRKYDNTWQDIAVLTHELVHYKQYQWESKLIKEEWEFEAYFIENCLFQLQLALQKTLGIYKK